MLMAASPVQMGRKKESSDNPISQRIVWTDEQFNLFVDICIRGSNNGKRKGGGWGESGWNWVRQEMKNSGYNLSKDQLKHKWDWMKGQFKVWKELIGKETRLGWDPKKGTIVASDEWWTQKIKEFPFAAKLRDKGIGEELFSKYAIIFMGSVAAREYAWAPSSNVFPQDMNAPPPNDLPHVMNETNNNNLILADASGNSEKNSDDMLENMMGDRTNLADASTQATNETVGSKGVEVNQGSGRKQKRIDATSSTERNKKWNKGKKPTSDADQICETIRGFAESMKETFGDKSGCSIGEVMEDITSLPKMVVGCEMHYFAAMIMEQKEKREMYRTFKTDELKWGYLRFQHDLVVNGKFKVH